MYIGETGLHLDSRIKSHTGDKGSAVPEHCHGVDSFEWSLLKRVHSVIKSLNTFVIKSLNPSLNKSLGVEFKWCCNFIQCSVIVLF